MRAAPKGGVAGAVQLTPEEDRLLRAAFGRYGGAPAARIAAAPVVRRYQQAGAGAWLLCDCLGAVAWPPLLVPVAQTHIRRQEDERWPVHCDACDFRREPEEQRAIAASYTRAAAEKPLSLARPLVASPDALRGRLVASSAHSRRPGLARLLMRLVTEAGLQRLEAGVPLPELVDQVTAIWGAASGIELDAGVPLREFLCTSPAKLAGLMERIDRAPLSRFRRTRPHGVLITRLAAVGEGMIQPAAGPPIAVRGRLAVFAEAAGGGSGGGLAAASARAPYLAACVVGRPSPDEPVAVLGVYAHPCAGAGHLMLLDSDYERQTLAQLRRVQAWLGRREGVVVAIERPLFDIGPPDEAAEGTAAPGSLPRPPCIPDFVVRARRPDGACGTTTVVVETMGFADQVYRQRKERMHALMAAVLSGAPVVVHDFHEPRHYAQEWRDGQFWRAARRALTPAGDGGVRREPGVPAGSNQRHPDAGSRGGVAG